MKILEIHEITDEMLKYDCSAFDLLTFDDCLFSQYKYLEHFSRFHVPMVFLFSTGIYRRQEPPRIADCGEAHFRARQGDFSAYMSLAEIAEVSRVAEIGYHSARHPYLGNLRCTDRIRVILKECALMLNYSTKLKYFVPPYNQPFEYCTALKRRGISVQMLKDRIPIESVCYNTLKREHREYYVNDIRSDIQRFV